MFARLCFLSFLICLLIILISIPAYGQDSSQNSDSNLIPTQLPGALEEARMQFELARRYYHTGRFELAGRTFETSYELSGHRELLYNAHMAYRQAGMFRDALRTLEGYVPSIDDPTTLAANQARLERLREVVARLEPQPESIVDQADSVEPEPEATQVELTETIEVAETAVSHGARRIGWSTAGIAGALAITSTATGVAALRAEQDLDAAGCSSTLCPQHASNTLDRGRRLQRTTDALWITAIVVAAVGTIWALVRRGRTQRASTEVQF